MITNLFTYGITRYTLDLADDYVSKIIDYGIHNARENGQTEGNLQSVELFHPLNSVFATAVRSHIEELGYDTDNEFVVTQMWLNRYVKDDSIELHTHPNSIYSGVLYIGENLTHGTVFHRPVTGSQLEIKVKTMNEYTADTANIEAARNSLIIFPSFLQHRAVKNSQESARYTISFNSLPRKFGDYSKLNYFVMP